jgi:uncharacterized protein (DUF58 family)
MSNLDTNPGKPNTSALAMLRQLEWRVRHAVENVLSGEYRSAFRGRGMEFDQVVKYEFGDDVRDIDWNVTARLGEAYRKKFVEEREVTLLIVFEDSPSLQFGSGAQSKREALLELGGLVMLLGAVNRDRVGFVHATPTGYVFREPVRTRLAAVERGCDPVALAFPSGSQTQRAALVERFSARTSARRMAGFAPPISNHGLPRGRPVGAAAARW